LSRCKRRSALFLTDGHISHISGVVFLDKPQGWTSRHAVNEVSRIFGRIKAGHAGTLDPLATGMLPILLGEATRFAGFGLDADKFYEVCIDLSRQTDTLDTEGKETGKYQVKIDDAQLQQAISGMQGEQEQLPPAYSAIRIHGQRAHDLARRGKPFELPPRQINIGEIRLLGWDNPLLKLFVHCSKGTYIRALARDIGTRLGLGGCVTALRRLSCGGWLPETMVDIDAVRRKGRDTVVPLAEWLAHLPRVELARDLAQRFMHGQRLPLDDQVADEAVAVFFEGELLGTGTIKPGFSGLVLHPGRVLPSAQELLA